MDTTLTGNYDYDRVSMELYCLYWAAIFYPYIIYVHYTPMIPPKSMALAIQRKSPIYKLKGEFPNIKEMSLELAVKRYKKLWKNILFL